MPKKKIELWEWRQLYEIMKKIKALAPWDWMREYELFGIRNPADNQLAFVSVMGTLGEHFGISVYLGEKGLYKFWEMQDSGGDVSPEVFLEAPQLAASLDEPEYLYPQDIDIMNKLGIKLKEGKRYPKFRSHYPGCYPWYLEQEEGEFLRYALEQTIDVARRFKADPDLIKLEGESRYLMRTAEKIKGKLLWQDSYETISLKEYDTINIEVNPSDVKKILKIAPNMESIEVDLFISMEPLRDNEDERPYFPYILVVVDSDIGLIQGFELLKPLPTFEGMLGSVPGKLLDILVKKKISPENILYSSRKVGGLLAFLCEELGIEMKFIPDLPNLRDAREGISKHLESGEVF